MRVAVVAGPDPGHAFPSIALAFALAARGHDVTVATGERWGPDVAPLAFVPIPRLDADDRDADFGFRMWGRGREMAPLLADALAPHRPEVVVADTLTVPGWFAADLLGVPRVELVPHLLQLPSRGLPPPGLAVTPGRTPLGSARDALLRRLHARSLAAAARERAEARRAIGLPDDGPPALRLVATLPAMEWPRPDWPGDTHVVGTLEWEPPGPRLEPPPGDGPLVLVADSTATGGRTGLLGLALSELPATTRIVATRMAAYDGPVPPNARIGPGRQVDLLDRVDAVVSPGGHGLLSKALARGVPVVVLPGPGDQAANALRAATAGAAVVVRRPDRLARAVAAVTTDPAYREAASRAAASARGLGPDYAASLVERVVRRSSRP